MAVLTAIFKILVFPGLLFILALAAAVEFTDRKLYARMQNRKGPKWFIPIADFFKLIGKQSIIPANANKTIVSAMPVVSLASVIAASVYIPVTGLNASFSFDGDIIVVLYFLSMPVLTQFLAGWYSRSVYATIGSVRVVTQMFAYEIPLFMTLLAPTILAQTWSVSGLVKFYNENPLLALINIPAFAASLVTLQCKLARAPFDAPEAETEIVGGPFVEYGGRLLAFYHLSNDCEAVVAISLVAAVFVPFTTEIFALNILLYLIKVFVIVCLLSLIRASMARLRINNTLSFCWKVLVPVASLQIIINLLVRSFIA